MSYGSRLARLKALEVEKDDGWLPIADGSVLRK